MFSLVWSSAKMYRPPGFGFLELCKLRNTLGHLLGPFLVLLPDISIPIVAEETSGVVPHAP